MIAEIKGTQSNILPTQMPIYKDFKFGGYTVNSTIDAYDKCVAHAKDGACLLYSCHGVDDCDHFGYSPQNDMFAIRFNHDYYTLKVVGKLTVDRAERIVHIKELTYVSQNEWSVICRIRSSRGTMKGFKKHVDKKYFDSCILKNMVRRLFGENMKINTCSDAKNERPMDESDFHAVFDKNVFNWYYEGIYNHGARISWCKQIVLVPVKKTYAASIIQAVYKGWKVRMQYRYNPHTRLGKYLLIKNFEAFI